MVELYIWLDPMFSHETLKLKKSLFYHRSVYLYLSVLDIQFFKELYSDIIADHKTLLFYSHLRCLSNGKMYVGSSIWESRSKSSWKCKENLNTAGVSWIICECKDLPICLICLITSTNSTWNFEVIRHTFYKLKTLWMAFFQKFTTGTGMLQKESLLCFATFQTIKSRGNAVY